MSDAATSAATNIAPADLYGVVAEFSTPEAVTEAAEQVRDAGYIKIDAFTPFPVEGLDESLGMEPTRLGWVVLAMGLIGGLTGFFMQYYANVHFYPINIGGKPLNSWPNFIVITFEFAIIFSAFTAGLFMLGRNGLPRLYQSIFNTPNFEAASKDKFFLLVESKDPKFELEEVKTLLNGLNPDNVSEVEV